MELKSLDKNKNEVVFELSGTNYVVANTIRRLVNSEVCTLAIEDAHIIKNSSALYDEMLAHRLGLVPLKTDLKSYTKVEDCKCKGKGCAHCQLKFTLKVKGPCTVYASDLVSEDKKVVPVYPNMPLVKLLKGQELEMECTAILSNGKNHTKFTPGLVYYHNYPQYEGKNMGNINEKAGSKDKFVFHIEPWGQLEVKEMLMEAVKIMDSKLDEFEKLVKKL